VIFLLLLSQSLEWGGGISSLVSQKTGVTLLQVRRWRAERWTG